MPTPRTRAEREYQTQVEDQALVAGLQAKARATALSRQHTPEQAPIIKRRAVDLSVPFEFAATMGDEAVDEIRARQAAEAVKAAPRLARPLGDPYIATIADGDNKEMVRTSRAVQAVPERRSYPVIDGFKALFGLDGSGSVRQRTPEEQARFEAEQAKLGKVFGQGFRELGVGVTANIADLYAKAFEALGIDPTAAQTVGVVSRLRATETLRQGDAMMPTEDGAIKRGVFSGVRSLPGSLTGLGVAAAAGPLAGAGFIGANTQGRSYVEGRNQGLGVGAATRYAATDAAIEIATEYVPFARLLNDTPVGSTLGKRLLRNLVDEQIGEQAATALQDLNAWATLPENEKKTFSDYLSERPDAALQTAIATLVSSGATNTVVALADKAARTIAKTQTATEDAVTLDTIMDSATKHKMRERDPEAFAEYIDSQTEGTGAENVYVPIEAIETLFQSEILDENVQAFFEQYQDQIEEARATGGDVVIPTSAIAARLAGTPAWEALKPDARLDAGGFSPRQVEEETKNAETILEQRGEEIAAAALDEVAVNAPVVAVFEDVKAQLVAAGFTDSAATKQASLYAANREAWGKRLGMTALEYHQANPVRFERAGLAPAAADAQRVMDQPKLFSRANPTPRSLRAMVERSKEGRLRGVVAPNGDTFWWDAFEKTHDQGAKELGVPYFPNDEDNRLFARVEEDGSIVLEQGEGDTANALAPFVGDPAFSFNQQIDTTLNQASRYDERFGDQPITVADRFANPATLLQHDDWAILTAENPRGEQADEVTNARAMRDLEADLQAMGLVYTRAVGKYGQIENSFAVVGITQAEAEMLGRKYDQDSVLTKAGLTYQDGSVNPATGSVDVFEERPDDFFTEIPELGVQFAVGIDFEVKISPTTGVAGWTDQRLDKLIESADASSQKRYVVMMSPDEFLGLTLSQKGRKVVEEIVEGFGPLDADQLRSSGPQTLLLNIGGEPSAMQKAGGMTRLPSYSMGHDGRHRATLLKQNGVTMMPVVLNVARGELPSEPVIIGGNRSREALSVGDTPFKLVDPIELTADNRAKIAKLWEPATILFQSENPIFYSALARAIESSKQAKAPASQWKGVLQNAPGVKAEELEWSGLIEMLDFDPKAVFTKEELATAVERGGIKIEERVLSADFNTDLEIEYSEEDNSYGVRDGRDWVAWFDSYEEANEYTNNAEELPASQFQSWSSDPSNDTYRELLLTLPIGQGGNPERAPSTHWDQPAVVAHVRFMDKEDVDGNRVLFVEEVQSDWHQKGRDQGYEQKVDPKAVEAAQAKYDAARAEYIEALNEIGRAGGETFTRIADERPMDGSVDPWLTGYPAIAQRVVSGDLSGAQEIRSAIGAEAYPVLVERYGAARNNVSLAGRELDVAKGLITNGGVPNAPFKTSWPALVMKRVIKYAVDGGYDKVAWTTGEQQADRYSLAEATGPLTVGARDSGGYTVNMAPRAAEMLVQQNLGGFTGNLGQLRMTEDQMKEAFGNDITKRAIEGAATQAFFTLEGEDLKIGGEGMKAFYDRNLVNITNGLVKKAGAKVGPVPMELGEQIGWTEEDQNRIAEIDAQIRDMQGAAADRYRAAKPANLSFDEEQKFIREYGASDAEREAQAAFMALKLEKERITKEAVRRSAKTQPGFEITDALRDQASGGFPLFQKTGAPRGQIAMYTDKMVITLFEDADLSTLLHETGHLFVEELARNAQRPNAPADVKADWVAMKKWLKQNGHPVVKNVIPREAHELMARGFERYLMEGRAPSKNLETFFGTFRAWLVRIYQNVQRLASPITPEVREVFDRLLATQEAIDAYREEQNAKPLFADKPADMTQAEFDAYRTSVLASRDEATARLTKKVMDDIRKRENKRYRDRARDARDDVITQLNTEPRFVALHLLRTGRWLGDGERATTPMKIDRDWFVSTYGAAALDRLPKGPFLVKKDGDEIDFIAEMTGFPSGAALVDALFGMGEQQAQMRADGDRRSLFDREVDERVKALLEADGTADALSPDQMAEEAQAAVENERQGDLLSTELRYLSRGTGQTPTPYRLARVWAERKIRAGTVQAVASRAAVQQYARAAAKAGRLAEEALIAGDTNETYRQKQAQLINHALFMEAKLAADRVDTIVARMRRLGKRAAMKSVDQDYMDRVHGLLEGFDFRKKSRKFLEEQQGFVEWAAGQAALGFEVQIPPRLMLNGTPYTRASVEELYGLDDAVKALLHLGKLKQGILDGQAEREFSSLIDEMVAKIADLPDRKLPTEINEEDRRVAGVMSMLIKIETIADDLDGGDPNGPFNRLLTQRVSDQENLRAALRDRTLDPISKTYLGLPAAHRRRLEEKVTLPELPHRGGELDPRNGGPTTMTRMELLSVALNTGNLSNLEKMAKGEGWNANTIRDVLNRELKKEDWDFVQKIWDSIATLWPEIAATERRLSGVVPEQVEITPVSTPFGEYRGGYYPVVYDPARSQRAESHAIDAANDLFGMKSGINTPKGHTISRTEASGPILRSVEAVLFTHIEKVITRIAYAEYARDVLRTMDHPRVRNAIDLKLGREYRKQMRPWLQRVVNATSTDLRGLNYAEKFIRAARVNMSLVAMGFRVSTGIAQIGGWNQAAGRIGPRYLALGMKTVLRDRGRAIQFIFDRSPEMERRNNKVNRDVADAMKAMRNKDGWINKARTLAFWHIGMIDRYVVAAPTWLGAHAKAIDDGMTDREASLYADKMVRTSQGSGAEKDLSNWQSPTSELMRSLTLFYTIFNVQLNAQWESARAVKKGDYMKAVSLTGWFLLAAPLVDALLSGDIPDADDDEDTWTNWFARNVFFNLFSGVPLVRDVSSYYEREMAGEYATTGTSPLNRAKDAAVKAGDIGIKAAQGEDLPDTVVKTMIETPGYFLGLPTGQAGATGQFLWDYSNGDVDPQTVNDWYWGLTKGKMPEE